MLLKGIVIIRIKLDDKNILVSTDPELLLIESNLVTLVGIQKSIGINYQDLIENKLVEIYTHVINSKLVNEIISNCDGETYEINMKEYITKYIDYNARLDAFLSELINVDTELATKSSISDIRANVYLVGTNIGNWFRKLVITGSFVDNTTGLKYANGLIGHYNNIPVLCHTDVGVNDGYAIYKPSDGLIAPIIRGIYSPLNNIPELGSLDNPTPISPGTYYQEKVLAIAPKLIQKFSVNAM